MATQASVINAALHVLGEPEEQAPMTSTNTWTKRVRDRLDERARACMGQHPGNFCTTVMELTASEPTPDGWGYGFDVPGGAGRMLRIIKVSDSASAMDRDSAGIPFEDRAGRILTDSQSTWLKFVDGEYATQFGAWPHAFADYVAADLAEAVMPTLEGSDARRQLVEKRLKMSRNRWKNWDAQQQGSWTPPPSRWQRARFSGRRPG